MAWRNIWRNPRRTILTLCAIAFASLLLIFMLSFQFGSYETMINSAVKIHTGHLQIQAVDYHDRKSIRLLVPQPAVIGNVLAKIPQVEAFAFRAEAFSLASSQKRTYGVLVTGIDPQREAQVSKLKKLIRKGEYLTQGDYDQALVGQLLANNLKVKIGEELTILGQGRDGSVAATVVRVKGIYRSGLDAFDRASIHIPLNAFQDLYNMEGAVHVVVAVGKSLSQVSRIKALAQKGLSAAGLTSMRVLDWEALMPGLREAIEMDLISGLIFYGLLIIVVAFSILNTFLMAIFERTREFGVLMAIGTTPRRLTKLLLIESMSITILGIVAGVVSGILVTYYFQVHGIDVSGSSELLGQFGISGRMYPKLSGPSILIGPGMVLIVTFLAALYPALKVRGLRPVEAMSSI
ncbi:MAG: ABC transporter permease [Deltaproteobacteria bacterium]|nr:ABC transporter permease [Deltaproteobacteria bacterium]